MQELLTRLTLANGLRILLKEIHTAPLISHWIWYRVGSRNETPGITGVSHWVEHMLFKGTPQFPARLLDRLVARDGGYWNASTSLDWTTYFETMPAGAIDLALRLEADRMLNGAFDPESVAAERTVIISERQGSENEPLFRLAEAVQAVAYRLHPYRHETIGDLADLQSMQREHLYQHYRAYYVPGNAVLAVAGDFETEHMLARIRELYEPIPGAPAPDQIVPAEPPQQDERRLVVQGPGATTYIQASYHAPAAADDDFLALAVLDSLLAGPSGLNMFGGGLSNKTSRLYCALVDTELAVGLAGSLNATLDPYLYTILITVHPQSSPQACLAALDDEIRRLQDAPPPAAGVARAVKQARALFAYSSESITNQAFWLGFAEMFADYDWFATYLERLAAVTPQDVQRAAQTYLRPQNRTLGVYQPEGQPPG